jgi:site-specific DNA-cytosine methylase
MRPLALDLCCGMGGWTDGLIAAGFAYRVSGQFAGYAHETRVMRNERSRREAIA